MTAILLCNLKKAAYITGVFSVRTVENDVVEALGGRSCVAAGRTDRDVSALSQVRRNIYIGMKQYAAH